MAGGSAFARAALAGNPSDGHGGAVLAVCVPGLARPRRGAAGGADASAIRRARWSTPRWRASGAARARCAGPRPSRARSAWPDRARSSRRPCARSAPCTATSWRPTRWPRWCSPSRSRTSASPPGRRTATPRPTRGSCSWTSPARARASSALDPALLPSLYLAWRPDAAEASHAVHGGLRDRAAEPALRAGMARLAGHARAARDALHSGDHAAFAAGHRRLVRRARGPAGPRSPPRGDGARRARRGGERELRGLRRGDRGYPAAQAASSPWRARCARWAARSSR